MSFTLGSGPSLTKITATPFGCKRETYQKLVSDLQTPDGVHLSQGAIDSRPEEPGRPRSFEPTSAATPTYTPEEVAEIHQHTEGAAQWAAVTTDSGVRGEVVKTAAGVQYRLLLPDGLLPEPLVVERSTGKVEAHTLDGQALAIKEDGPRLYIDLGHDFRAVLNEQSYCFGMESPKQLMQEFLFPDGRREIVAEHKQLNYTFAGETDTIQEQGYQITQSPNGNWSASYQWHQHSEANFRRTLRVQPEPDGSLELTPKLDWWTRCRDNWSSYLGLSHDFTPCADHITVTPFSALSAEQLKEGMQRPQDPKNPQDSGGRLKA